MIVRQVLFSIVALPGLICWFGAALPASTGTGPATTLAAERMVIERVATILGESGGQGDPMLAIADAVKASKAGRDFERALTDAILNAKPTVLRAAVLDHIAVRSLATDIQVQDAAWSYGSAADREKMRAVMWRTAKANAKTDPDGARRMARAAILFRSMDDIPNGPYGLLRFLNDPQGMQVAGITAEQLLQLRAVQKEPTQNFETVGAVDNMIDRLFKHPDTTEFQNALGALSAWSKTDMTVMDQLAFARALRQFMNHAVAANNHEMMKAGADLDAELQATATTHFKRWLAEVNTSPDQPTRLMDIALWQDGKWVETDTDGNPIK